MGMCSRDGSEMDVDGEGTVLNITGMELGLKKNYWGWGWNGAHFHFSLSATF